MQSIVPDGMQWHYDEWHLSPLVVHDGVALASGVTGTRADGSVAEAPREEFVDAFEKLQAVLAAGGLDLGHVLEMTTFHVEMAHMDDFREVRDRYLQEPWPAWSAVGTTELAVPGPRVEIRVMCRAT